MCLPLGEGGAKLLALELLWWVEGGGVAIHFPMKCAVLDAPGLCVAQKWSIAWRAEWSSAWSGQ